MYPINPMNPMFILALASSKELQDLHQRERNQDASCPEAGCEQESRQRSPLLARIFGRSRRQTACEAC